MQRNALTSSIVGLTRPDPTLTVSCDGACSARFDETRDVSQSGRRKAMRLAPRVMAPRISVVGRCPPCLLAETSASVKRDPGYKLHGATVTLDPCSRCVTVIGAGLDGAACVGGLRGAAAQVTWPEKVRSAGGRMAPRRAAPCWLGRCQQRQGVCQLRPRCAVRRASSTPIQSGNGSHHGSELRQRVAGHRISVFESPNLSSVGLTSSR